MMLPSLLLSMIGSVPPVTGDAGGGFWMPPQASTFAGPQDRIFFMIYWICVFFFVLIVALMILFVIKYRRREGHSAEKTATHNTPLEITWTVIPLMLVIVIFYVGLKGYADMTQEPANAYEVYVTAQQWSWSFSHPDYAVVDSGVLTVPAGRPVKLIMTSTDVLHDLFVPAFRLKQDCVPGRYTYLWFEAPEAGDHQIFCAEYCGTDHSQMTARLQVREPDEFDAIMTQRANVLKELTADDYPQYVYERIYPRCQSCHRLDRLTKQGPGFWTTHELWGKNRRMKDGREVLIDENYIHKSIVNPQADIVADMPGVMATFQGQLSELEIQAIIEFLKHLDTVVDEDGNPIKK